MQPAVVVCGTLALDVIGSYDGVLALTGERPASLAEVDPSVRELTHAGPVPRVGPLRQSLRLNSLHVDFGGCAMNISYSLALLGAAAYPVVRVGRDFEPGYASHLREFGISTRGVLIDPAFASSSHCIVLSDRDGNQLTAFYPGSSDAAATARRPHHDPAELAAAVGARLAVIAPDVGENMVRHAELLMAAGVPFITDPGQGLSDFTPAQAQALLARTRRLIVNASEWQVLLRLLGQDAPAARARLDWLVITEGAEGVQVWQQDVLQRVPAIAPQAALDHTGCGDALRAGLAFGTAAGANLLDALRIGVLTATYNLEVRGCQRHRFTQAEFAARYRAAWGRPMPLA